MLLRVALPGAEDDEADRDRERTDDEQRPDIRQAQAKLRSEPAVEYAHADYVARTSGFVPNDPGFGGLSGWVNIQWNLLDQNGIRAEDACSSQPPLFLPSPFAH